MGVDPTLQNTPFQECVSSLRGYAAAIRKGKFSRQPSQVRATTVGSALTAVGKACEMVHGVNPTKKEGSDKFVARLQQTLDGWRKDDPPCKKELPVEADVPEWLVDKALEMGAGDKDLAIADLIQVAFYYLLRVGEYTHKAGTRDSRSRAKQTQPFRMKDVAFFGWNKSRQRIYRLPRTASDEEILNSKCVTLQLDNQKNGWKGVCINHEHNGDPIHCGTRAIARRYIHIRRHTNDMDTPLYTFYENGSQGHITDKDIRAAVKKAATALDYQNTRGIPLSHINTHSLRIGGACALALAGYSDTQIMKMGRWRGATFQEYIRENLSNYSEGKSTKMKEVHGFVQIDAGAFTNVTDHCCDSTNDYSSHRSTAAAA